MCGYNRSKYVFTSTSDSPCPANFYLSYVLSHVSYVQAAVRLILRRDNTLGWTKSAAKIRRWQITLFHYITKMCKNQSLVGNLVCKHS